jgi:hypothetical protein
VVDHDQRVLGLIDEAAIVHDFVRGTAAGGSETSTSGLRAIDRAARV